MGKLKEGKGRAPRVTANKHQNSYPIDTAPTIVDDMEGECQIWLSFKQGAHLANKSLLGAGPVEVEVQGGGKRVEEWWGLARMWQKPELTLN